MTALVSPSNSTGSTTMFCRLRRAEARVDRGCSRAARSVSRMRCFSSAHWPTSPRRASMRSGWSSPLRVAGEQLQSAGVASATSPSIW